MSLGTADGFSAPTNKVNSICDALRQLLESQDLVKYVETILTTHVCKQPADYESGLRLLLQLQGTFSRTVYAANAEHRKPTMPMSSKMRSSTSSSCQT